MSRVRLTYFIVVILFLGSVMTANSQEKVHVKTNLLGLGAGLVNGAAEIDLCSHVSFNLPVYYSAWNHITDVVKFRVLMTQPEFRFWISDRNDGFFMGAHFGVFSYNVALGGDYRFQDHDGTSPALGGGISLGYRLPISRTGRWKMEFSLGAGAYALHYDRFLNTEDTCLGAYVDTRKHAYWGPDNVSASLIYMFDLKRGGREDRRK